MRTLRWLALFLILFAGIAGAGLWGALRWLEGPAGCAWVSERVTRGLQEGAPGTEVTLEGLRLHRGIRAGVRLEVARAVWRKRAGQELAELAPVEVWARLAGRPRRLLWEARGQVRRLDLAALDEVLARGEWRASGLAAGPVELSGEGGELHGLGLRLEALPPGGDLSSELLQGLVAMMPAGDSRQALLKSLAGKALFHFNVGKVEVATGPERYTLHLLVDGDHLLDITVHVPKESVEFLKQLFL